MAPIVRWPLKSPWRLVACVGGLVAVLVVVSQLSGGPSPSATPSPGASTATASPSVGTATPSPTGTTGATSTPNPSASDNGFITNGSGEILNYDPNTQNGDQGTPDADTAPPPETAVLARDFVAAWARPNLPQQQWLIGVQQYSDSYLRDLLKLTDPRTIPASKVTGPPEFVDYTGLAVGYRVPTNGGTVHVSVSNDGIRWWVSSIELDPATIPSASPSATK